MGFGRALLAGATGAALGAAAVLAVAAAMGMLILFLAWPLYAAVLALCGLVSSFLAAVATAFSRALSWGAAMLIGGFATIGGFSAVLIFIAVTTQGGTRW